MLFEPDVNYEVALPGSSFDSASDIDYGDYSVQADEEAWFNLTLDPGLFLAIMVPSGGDDINMELYNSARQVVAASFAPGTERIEYRAQFAGDYYLKLYPTATSSAQAHLLLSDQVSHANDDLYDSTATGNDSFANAVDFSSLTTLNVQDQVALDDDWYRVAVLPGTFTVDVPDNLDIEVYNSNKDRIAASSGSSPTVDIQVLSADTYYIAVSGGSGQPYNLIAGSETVWVTELDFGPIRDVSITLFDIDQDGKDEIFIGTSKGLDSALNEVRPAGLVVLEDDGSLKWSVSFVAMSTPDSQTGKQYQTSSVSTAPVFSDLDNDGEFDLVIGVGGDTTGEAGANVPGQPGDKGGVYALDANGNIKWFHESLDTIGGAENTGDGRPDGVYGTPVIFDINGDGNKEVIYGGWDQQLWILDGRTGEEKVRVNMADTIWATPRIADIDEDGRFEILVSADITANAHAGVTTGGIFHIVSADGSQMTAGFDQLVASNPAYETLKGKWEEQTLWSSPVTGDLDGDGHLEIAYGTGNFFHDDRGSYIKVWNHDGTLKFELDTNGRTFATPLITDLDGDGDKELIATTLNGYLYGWDHNGNQLFATATLSFGAFTAQPIFSSPLAVDLTGDGKKEIIYAQGAQLAVVNYQGQQLSDNTARHLVVESYKGSPAIKDIDNDGALDIISGGHASDSDAAVVYRWANSYGVDDGDFINDRYQFSQSTTNISDFVERFYRTVLGREAEVAGRLYWVDSLVTGTRTGADVAQGFIFSQEFANRSLSDTDFVNTLYTAFFDRPADPGGFNNWLSALTQGAARATVLEGFIYSQEFRNLTATYSIVAV